MALAPAANSSGYSTFDGDSSDYNQTVNAGLYSSGGSLLSAWAGDSCSSSRAAICEGISGLMYTCPSVSSPALAGLVPLDGLQQPATGTACQMQTVRLWLLGQRQHARVHFLRITPRLLLVAAAATTYATPTVPSSPQSPSVAPAEVGCISGYSALGLFLQPQLLTELSLLQPPTLSAAFTPALSPPIPTTIAASLVSEPPTALPMRSPARRCLLS